MENRAVINKIIPFSNVDGPGNRYALFFQGCNIHCMYCHNHETIHLCNHCGRCVDACQYGALKVKENKVVYHEKLCQNCDSCIMACEYNASPKTRIMSVQDVYEDIMKYKSFIRGITVSGGEPTLYKDFLVELFQKVKTIGLSCFVDTNGFFDWESHLDLIEIADKFMVDIKAVGEGLTEICGTTMKAPISNLKELLKRDKVYEIRTVVLEDEAIEKAVKVVTEILKDYPQVPYRLIKVHFNGLRQEQILKLAGKVPSEAYMDKLYRIIQGKS